MKDLSEREQQALKILESCGWEVVTGAHLEDWDEGQVVGGDSMECRSELAVIKL